MTWQKEPIKLLVWPKRAHKPRTTYIATYILFFISTSYSSNSLFVSFASSRKPKVILDNIKWVRLRRLKDVMIEKVE